MVPAREEIPAQYHELLAWYEDIYCGGPVDDSIRRMWGLGRELWIGAPADEYVDSLRSGWGRRS